MASLLSGCKFLEGRIPQLSSPQEHLARVSAPSAADGTASSQAAALQKGTMTGGAGLAINPERMFPTWPLLLSSDSSFPLLWLWTFLAISWLSSKVGRSWPRTQFLSTGLCPPCGEAAALNKRIWALQPCCEDPPQSL